MNCRCGREVKAVHARALESGLQIGGRAVVQAQGRSGRSALAWPRRDDPAGSVFGAGGLYAGKAYFGGACPAGAAPPWVPGRASAPGAPAETAGAAVLPVLSVLCAEEFSFCTAVLGWTLPPVAGPDVFACWANAAEANPSASPKAAVLASIRVTDLPSLFSCVSSTRHQSREFGDS
jgi:hypothetical protein